MLRLFTRNPERYKGRSATLVVVVSTSGAENQVLKEKLGEKRILLSDDQRRRLAIKGKILGRKALQEIPTIFTPDTILRWYRELVARKWDYRRSPRRSLNSCCSWPEKVPHGATIASRVYSPISAARYPSQPSLISSENTASSRRREENVRPPGMHS
jgi:hypothetical protein